MNKMDKTYDFRGNAYDDAAPLYRTSKTVKGEDGWTRLVKLDKPEIIICEIAGCNKHAIRNSCVAEGGFRRTHWHGAIHTKDGGLKYLCAKHADIENAKWINKQTD